MNQDRTAGALRQVKGSGQKAIGKLTGNTKLGLAARPK